MNNATQALGQTVNAEKEELAKLITDEHWARNPHFHVRYGAAGHAKCVKDVTYNLAYLSQAIASNSPRLFIDYVDWVKILFEGLHIPTQELVESLQITRERLQQRFPEAAPIFQAFTDVGIAHLVSPPQALTSFLDDSHSLSALARQYLNSLRRGERSVGSQLILNAVAERVSVRDIYLHVFQPSQHEIGRLWQMNQLSVAQEHYCTAATQLIMSQLYPHICNTKRNGRCLVATCVGGELHEIGLRMVADFFEMEGWDTYYLGSDTPASSIIQALRDRNADVLAISATLTFHVRLVADLINRVRSADCGKPIKIVCGGYPFNVEPTLWQQVGADGFASSAEGAVETTTFLMAT